MGAAEKADFATVLNPARKRLLREPGTSKRAAEHRLTDRDRSRLVGFGFR
jgi:hypothetical protein